MRVAIIGSSSYIARYLLLRLGEDSAVEKVLRIDCLGEADVYIDLRNAAQFDTRIFTDIDLIIFTAAISSPDQCSVDYKDSWEINVIGTGHIIRQAMNCGCRVLFFSSDAVFGDIPGKIYDESSITLAETAYGRMKKTIEDCFFGDSLFKAIRLSYVVSSRDRFISYCIKCMNQGKTAEIFHPFYRNCIMVTDVVDTVQWLLYNWETYDPPVLNVAGDELVSRIRIADELNRLMQGQLKYEIQKPQDVFYQNRPAITQMKSLYLQKYGILEIKSFTERFQKEFGGLVS